MLRCCGLHIFFLFCPPRTISRSVCRDCLSCSTSLDPKHPHTHNRTTTIKAHAHMSMHKHKHKHRKVVLAHKFSDLSFPMVLQNNLADVFRLFETRETLFLIKNNLFAHLWHHSGSGPAMVLQTSSENGRCRGLLRSLFVFEFFLKKKPFFVKCPITHKDLVRRRFVRVFGLGVVDLVVVCGGCGCGCAVCVPILHFAPPLSALTELNPIRGKFLGGFA